MFTKYQLILKSSFDGAPVSNEKVFDGVLYVLIQDVNGRS